MDIEKVLIESLRSRGVFHSEADFQHHFAWAIHNAFNDSSIRLEINIDTHSLKTHSAIIQSSKNEKVELID